MKRCGKCSEVKPFSEFYKAYTKACGYSSYCKECQHQHYKHRYHYRTKVLKMEWKRYNEQYLERDQRFLVEYLATHPCVDCGETDILVLEFDHVRGTKRAEISKLVRRLASLADIAAEIEKCVVRCANCHRRKTASPAWGRVKFWPPTNRKEVSSKPPLALDFPPEYSCLVLAPLAQW